ncbi:MAG: histidine kinase N-terminal 7TM domain-containing protein, partial [Chloroflexota bacterium]
NVIIACSLCVYIAARNPRNPVARGFVALMFFVAVVSAGDVLLSRVRDLPATVFWLRFQWIGIALVPAAYLHFSDALLRTTNGSAPWRRGVTFVGYVLGLVFFWLAVQTDLIVRDEIYFPFAPQFAAGPYFAVFVAYFLVTVAWGLLNTLWARHRCLTSTSRRRMNYLLISFAAPALGVFPYLLLANAQSGVAPEAVLILSGIGNSVVALMMVMMAYAVSYYGAIEPDRVVKRNLIKYLIQGPLMGTAAIGLIVVVPRFEQLFNLPPDSLVIFAAIVSIILFQVIVSLAKPILDVLSDWEDRREVAWLQRLDERFVTHSDQTQLLENILAELCDLLRARQGFVLAIANGELKLESFVGSRGAVLALLRDDDVQRVMQSQGKEFVVLGGVWLRPLFARTGESVLGVIGIASSQAPDELGSRARETIDRLAHQAERTLEDRQLQAVIFGALQELRPEIESLQRYRSRTPYIGSTQAAAESESKTAAPEFPQWVRDALRDIWGGPKFSESPLHDLKVVREALNGHEQSPTKALRSVLLEAIELLRPDGEQDLQAREWVLYNILRMKFVEGRRTREIADRLAMSESDLYRKQRLAIDEVARTLATMEQKVGANGNG